MIKGTDIILCNGENSEIVSNVLIGEPTVADVSDFSLNNALISYILAIPKGDNRIWTDRKIQFFGQTFRTVGFPQEGIEENIPLSWNKKVKVERLITNSDITFYEKNTFKKHIFKDVHIADNRGTIVAKNGEKAQGTVEIHIYAVNNDSDYCPKVGDIAVAGACDFEFDTSSEQRASESLAEFRKQNYFTVNSSEKQVYGIKPDFIISAR